MISQPARSISFAPTLKSSMNSASVSSPAGFGKISEIIIFASAVGLEMGSAGLAAFSKMFAPFLVGCDVMAKSLKLLPELDPSITLAALFGLGAGGALS
jgi:hypothetical protein